MQTQAVETGDTAPLGVATAIGVALATHVLLFAIPLLSVALAITTETRFIPIAIAGMAGLFFLPGAAVSFVVLAAGLAGALPGSSQALSTFLGSGAAMVLAAAIFHPAFWTMLGEKHLDPTALIMASAGAAAVGLPIVGLAMFGIHRLVAIVLGGRSPWRPLA